ncbi:hypothetical protein M0R45_018698 [Rubus argutus]|uniref:Uncharacterized protein n=1 Tax=Rubus argutus TaxID=59490 RepID=A0AAW1X5W7_RUBAR
MAYFWVQLLAVVSFLSLSVLYIWAISGTKGSSGFGSVNSEKIETRKQYVVNGQGGAPLFLQYVRANAAIAVNVRVKHLCPECNVWWFKRIVRRNTPPAYGLSPGPMMVACQVFCNWASAASGRRIFLEILEILQDPLGLDAIT